jgi:two-component sensor histidine kinase
VLDEHNDAGEQRVEDNGVGRPAATLGLRLVRHLVQQVEGRMTLGDEERGMRVTVPLARDRR